MPISVQPDQVLALAPDASSLKAARSLAIPRPWSNLGRDDRADVQPSCTHLAGQLLELGVARVDIHVRREQEQIHAVELDAVLIVAGQVHVALG